MRNGTSNDDRALVDRYLRDRDEDSFRLIYRRHTIALYRLALAVTGSPETAADVVQETWLRAARRLEAFRWSSSLRTWLSGIAINCCRETWRVPGKAVAISGAEPASPPRESHIDLMRAIRDLPDRARAVLVLHEIFGHTHAEIASLLDIEEGTSKSQLSYSRKLMRHWFDRRDSNQGGPDAER